MLNVCLRLFEKICDKTKFYSLRSLNLNVVFISNTLLLDNHYGLSGFQLHIKGMFTVILANW